MASQQGVYLARLFSRGFEFSATVPQKSDNKQGGEAAAEMTSAMAAHATGGGPEPDAKGEKVPLSEKLGLSVVKGKFAKPFQFLNLGILAYTGAGGALAQVQVGGVERDGRRFTFLCFFVSDKHVGWAILRRGGEKRRGHKIFRMHGSRVTPFRLVEVVRGGGRVQEWMYLNQGLAKTRIRRCRLSDLLPLPLVSFPSRNPFLSIRTMIMSVTCRVAGGQGVSQEHGSDRLPSLAEHLPQQAGRYSGERRRRLVFRLSIV